MTRNSDSCRTQVAAADFNRRGFITAAAGTFGLASASRLFGAGAPSNRVRLAIVGCHEKGRGFSVMKSAMKVPGVEIACVCDVDSRARACAADRVFKTTGVRPVQEKDLRKVVEMPDIDGIISETPDHWHAYSAVLAMKAGKAVYVEKPCCFCPEEGHILMRVARETGAVFQVGSQRRASLTYRAAIDWLAQKKPIGELKWGKCWYMANRESIGRGREAAVPEWLDWELWQGPAPRRAFHDNYVHYNWHWFRNWGTAEMGNNAPHFVDIARWALGIRTFPESVQCAGLKLFDRGDDYVWPDTYSASFKYPCGKLITFELTSHCNEKPYMDVGTGAMIYGERGSVYFGPNDTVKVFDEKSKLIREWLAGGVEKVEGTPVSKTNPTAGLDVLHLTKYADCIRAKDVRTNAPADEGVRSSILPILANLATDCGETIRLDPETGRLRSKAGAEGWCREYAKGWELV